MIAKPHLPGDEIHTPDGKSRVKVVLERILGIPDCEVAGVLNKVLGDFVHRHRDFKQVLQLNCQMVEHHLEHGVGLTEERRLLIGAYFTHEYSIEAAALCNPSLVPAPDQSGLAAGEQRFIMSVRAVGEGHVSSVEFRTGVIDERCNLTFDPVSRYAMTGMLVPACIFLVLMRGQAGINGWGAVTATDTAFAIGCLAVLGSRIPPSLRLFILSLAIFDDVGAILVVAIGYADAVNWSAVGAAAVGMAILAGTARVGIRSIPVYVVLGIAVWVCLDASGIHATAAGVALGLMAPTRRWVSNIHMRAILGRVLSQPEGEHGVGDTSERRDLRYAGTAARESFSPVERLESMLHPWVGFVILPIFALANAGVALSGANLKQPVSIAILVAFVLGKPAGVLGVSWLAVRLGLAARPPGLTWPLIVGGGLLTGIGFTMALFIAGMAFPPEQFGNAKFGVLLSSVISALAGIAVLFWLTSGRCKTHRGRAV